MVSKRARGERSAMIQATKLIPQNLHRLLVGFNCIGCCIVRYLGSSMNALKSPDLLLQVMAITPYSLLWIRFSAGFTLCAHSVQLPS